MLYLFINVSKGKVNGVCIISIVTFLVIIKLTGDYFTLMASSNPVLQPGMLALLIVCVCDNFLMFSEETRFS
jgi:hypothetical protein